MLTFEFFARPPSDALAPFVELIWGVRGGGAPTQELVLPDGAVELMINFGPTQRVVAYGDRAVDQRFERFWLAGIQDAPLSIASPDGFDHMGVRFRPGGAHAFFDLPMNEVANQVVDLDLLIGASAEPLREELATAGSHDARCVAIERWLLGRRYAVHPYYATTRRALDLLHGSAFRMGVGELCTRLGLSNRHLIEQFRRIVGLPPKTWSRLARFHAVVRAVQHHPAPDWAALAYRYNYADQPHLVREFRRFSGVTPSEFIGRRTADHLNMQA